MKTARHSQPSALNSPFKQTEVGVIPEDWEVSSLSRFWTVTDCKHITAQFVDNGFPIVSIKEVQSRFVDLKNAKQTTQQFFNLLIEGGRKPRAGDLILSRNATVGEVAQVAEWHSPFAMGQDVCLLRKKSPEFSTDYLQAVFRSPIIANQLSDLMVGSTFKRVNVQQIKSFIVPMPPPGEQEAIAEALSDADALIESLEQLIAKKHQIKQGAMQELLTGKRRLPGFRGEWEVKRVGEFTDCTAGGTPSTKVPEYWGGSIRWMNSGELHLKMVAEVEGRITDEGLRNSSTKMIPANCVLIGLAGQGKTRGTVAMNLVPLCTNQSIASIFPNATCAAKYLFYNLDSRYEELRELSTGEGGRGGLNLTIIKSLLVPLPSLPEQTAIAVILSDMDAEIAALEEKLAKACQLKQGTMQELLTGRIRLI